MLKQSSRPEILSGNGVYNLQSKTERIPNVCVHAAPNKPCGLGLCLNAVLSMRFNFGLLLYASLERSIAAVIIVFLPHRMLKMKCTRCRVSSNLLTTVNNFWITSSRTGASRKHPPPDGRGFVSQPNITLFPSGYKRLTCLKLAAG